MKKIIVLLVLLMASLTLFASNKEIDDLNLKLFVYGLNDEVLNDISSLSPTMDNSQKLMIYNEYKVNPWHGFLFNFFLGFGIGGYYAGDYFNAHIQLGLDIVSVIFLSVGLGFVISTKDPFNFSMDPIGSSFLVAGILISVSNKIYQLITPFTYANSENTKLQKALFEQSEVVARIEPMYINNKLGVGVNISF